ncbi:GM24824 [Drosophila sechellia]|uniref:GM24824 n=1 Tax=Drosophila sechellia TaxID=7238 RepID=B4HLS9_DROSE|nr:GM24824 [Drosophila sechellia]
MPMLPTIEEEAKLSWIRLMWKYRLQFQSMASASIVFVGCGMRLAWSIFDTPAGKFLNNHNTHNLMMSWFIGAALGALLAALFVQRVTKNVAYTSSGFLMIIAGILNVVLPQHFLAACYSSVSVGAAYGLTQIQALVTGSEVAHKSIRGMLLSCEKIFLWLGVCMQVFYTRVWHNLRPLDTQGYEMHIDQLHGMALAGLGLGAVILALAHRLESPILLLHQERDMAVGETLKALHGQSTTELVRLREDCRQLHSARDWERFVEEPEESVADWRVWARRVLPFFKVLLLRCFATLAVSLSYNRAFMVVSWHGLECDMNCMYWLAFAGLMGSVLGAFVVDWQGRRKLCSLSLFLAGVVIVMNLLRDPSMTLIYWVIALLMLLFEVIVAGGVAVPALVYTAEAFSIAHKARCLAGILILEQLLQLGLLLATFEHYITVSVFFFTIGVFSFIVGLAVFMFMPETRQLTLYECLLKFKKVP